MGRKKEVINPDIGQRIKMIRKGNHLTQAQFAELFSVTEQTVRNWEAGRRKIDLEIIREICNRFDCDMAYVLGIDAEIETRIEADVSSKYADSVFISYLSTLGIDVEIVPLTASDGIDVEANVVKPEIEYGYQVFYKNEEKHCYDEKGWIEFQDKVSKLIKLIL